MNKTCIYEIQFNISSIVGYVEFMRIISRIRGFLWYTIVMVLSIIK